MPKRPTRPLAIALAVAAPLALTAAAPALADAPATTYAETIAVADSSGGTTFSTNAVATVTVAWRIPDDAAAPVSIVVSMPRNANGTAILQATPSQAFTISDAGSTVAQCAVASDGLALNCVVDDVWLATHPSERSGTLTFPAKVVSTAPTGTFAPDFGGVTSNQITVTQSTWVAPRTSAKSAGPLQDSKGQIWWYVNVATPAGGWSAGQTITVTDTLGACQSWGALTKAQYVTDTSTNPTDPWLDVPAAGDYAVTTDGGTRTVVVTTRDAMAYRLVYTTTPDCGPGASPYENTATVNGTPVTGRWFWKTAGGTGYGSGGTFTLTKELVGTASDLVASDTAFTVNYSYTTPGNSAAVDGSLQIRAGESVASPILPATATVTLSEAAPTEITGASWAQPEFSRNGFELSTQGTVTATLTNRLDMARTDPVEPPGPSEPSTPTAPAALASTGSGIEQIMGWSVAATVAGIGLAVLALIWRRRTNHTRSLTGR